MISEFNLVHFVASTYKWRKHISFFTLLALVGSLSLSYMIEPSYESITTIYPSNPSLTDKAFQFESGQGNSTIELYGSKEDIDRVVSIAKSGQVLSAVIHKYNLFEHYEIDTTDKEEYPHPYSSAMSKLKKNLKVVKTEFRGIEISVKDKNVNLAADIANEIVNQIDKVAKDMIQSNRLKMLEIIKASRAEKDSIVTLLSDSLSSLRRDYSVYNISTQASMMTAEVTRTSAALSEYLAQRNVLVKKYGANDGRIVNLDAQISGLKEKLRSLTSSKSSSAYSLSMFAKASELIKLVETRRNSELHELTRLNKLHDYFVMATSPDVSYIFVMEKAYPAEEAVKFRALLVATCVLITLFISIVTVTAIDTFKS